LRRLVEEDSNILSNKRGKDIGLFYFLKLWLKNPKAVVEEGCYLLPFVHRQESTVAMLQ
jgi:hypothetical protein